MRLARAREWEASRMYELISSLAGLKDTKMIAQDLIDRVFDTFKFEHIDLFIPQKEGEDIAISTPSPSPPSKDAKGEWPLETARGVEGKMLVWHEREPLTSQEVRLLKAFTSQAALALERIRLARGEYMVHILEESDRLKSALLNSVSHELRTPLAVIKAAVSSLRSGAVNWSVTV